MSKYKESLMGALDVIKDSERCRECVGNCIECEYDKALDQIENAIEMLGELLENKPLEFEELKEGMWVWDNVGKEFLKVKCVCVADEGYYIFKEGTKIIEFVLCGISSRTVDVEFEPNRFYIKQV